MIFLKEADDETAEIKRRFTIRNRNLRKENRMSRKIGLALMVAAGLPVCAARAAEVSSGAEFAAALAGGAARWGRAAAEMWEKCGEKLDRRRAGAYIPGINAMAGGAGGCGGAYGARATGHGRRRCSGRNVHGRGSRSDDILDF